MPSSTPIITVVPIGAIDTDLVDTVARRVRNVFAFETEIVPLLPDVHFAFDPSRGQYHSTAILEKLAAAAGRNTLKILAVSDVDLFIPILTYVYGEAQLNGCACVVSTFRLTERLSMVSSRDAYINRVVKESIHELGHTFSLRHCKDRECIMHYCRTIGDVDRKSDELCRYCRILLEDEVGHLKKRSEKQRQSPSDEP